MYDKYKKRHQAPRASDRVRLQIAVEAARRMLPLLGPDDGDAAGHLKTAAESEYYTAKRKAAAVLGLRVRPGDLPSDSEVRQQVIQLVKSRNGGGEESDVDSSEERDDESLAEIGDHLDRFAVYKLRLEPLETVKQNPKFHPEGDALYHSLQVFERALEIRPYDEEFLLAALLHDVGKAIDPADAVNAGLAALRGTISERTRWLIEHHRDLLPAREKTLGSKARQALETSEYLEDLKLLREMDNAGRVPGTPVGTVDQALAYLKGLENEEYLAD